MHYLLIRNARLPRPDGDDAQTSILIADGKIISIGNKAQHPLTDTTEIDAAGRCVMPALISLSNPRPAIVDPDSLNNMNFEHATAGITSIITVSPNIEDNINDMRGFTTPLLNHAFHLPLSGLSLNDSKHIYRLMLREGIATAIIRMGDERHDTIHEMAPHVTAARILGLRVLYDIRSLIDRNERMKTLRGLIDILGQDKGNMAYILGIEYDDELELIKSAIGCCDLTAHLSFAPFNHGKLGKLSSNTIAETLRGNNWCSLGLAYSATRALKERWPDMTPEIISRNKLVLLNALQADNMLTPYELSEFVMGRPAEFVGLRPPLGSVREGAAANLLIWNHYLPDDARFAAPKGNIVDVDMRGKIDYVIMNGAIVVSDKFNHKAVCGKQLYSRIVK